MSELRRLLGAFLWLRWRTLVNGLGGRRRTPGARLRAWGEVALKVLLGLLVGVGALGLAVGAAFAVPALAAGGGARGVALLAVRGGLGVLIVALLFLSVFQAARGGGARASRLLLLPVSRRRLHGLELAAALADPWLLAVLPALLLLTGVTALLRPAGALPLLAAALLLVALLAMLSATAAFAVELLLRDRRRAEAVTLVVFVGWMALAVLPAVLDERLGETPETPAAEASRVERERTVDGAAGRRDGAGAERAARLRRRGETYPLWLQPLPSEAFALALARASDPEPEAARLQAWQGVGVLALEVLLLHALSLALWRRLLADPEGGSGPRGATAAPLPGLPLPGLTPAAAAVAWAQVRGVWRTLQGRLALVMPTLTVPVIAFVFRPEAEAADAATSTAGLLALAAVAFALLGQQAVLLNQFGIDGSGLNLEFLGPLAGRDLVRGKAAGGALLTLASLLPALLVVAALHARATPLLWPAALCAAAGAYALFAPLATSVSVLLPKAVDLGRIGREGQAHQGAALAGMLALGLVLTPAAGLGFVALALWKSPLLLLASQALLAAASWLIALPLLQLAADLLDRRRDALLLVVAGGD